MPFLRALVDYQRRRSPALRYRQARFRLFRSLVDRLSRPVRILDIGGTEVFWKTLGLIGEPGVHVTILNIEPVGQASSDAVALVQGDARDLSRYPDRFFDVAFSNSLIEHVGGLDDQRRAAREMQRVGRAYFVQTPNRHFPLEPHFLFPFFQHLPVSARVFLLTHLEIGWTGRIADREKAREIIESVRLLDRRTFRALFPEARIWEERAFGLVKSFVAYGGFPADQGNP